MSRQVRPARELVGSSRLAAEVGRLGAEISAAYPGGVVMVAVLKGGVWFLADLVRAVSVPCRVGFLAVSAYAGGRGRARLLLDLDLDIAGADVVLVEDIVDTGLTVSYLLAELGARAPASLAICALLDRQVRRIVPTELAFRGLCVGEEFLLGYGLDYAERYRNLASIVEADLAALRADPDAHVRQVYSG